jgi:acyl carrier protein
MVRERVRQFIFENFYVSDASRPADETSLLDEGFVDSTGMLEVIAFLETEFAVSVSQEEMTPENLETIGQIVRFVEDKLAKRVAANMTGAAAT